MSYEAIIEDIRRIGADPALRTAWRLRNRDLIREVIEIASEAPLSSSKPIPPVSQIVSIQTTLYDNDPRPKEKSEKIRYGFQFKVWAGNPEFTSMAITPPTFQGVGDLLTGEQLRRKAFTLNNDRPHWNPKVKKKPVGGSINEFYSSFMEDLASEYPLDMFSPIYSKRKGTGSTYHHGQLLRVTISDDRRTITDAELYLTTEKTPLSPFSNTDSGKNALTAPAGKVCLLQSRWVPSGSRHAGWATK